MEKKRINNNKRSGSITVEASLVLPIFMAAILIFIMYAKIAVVELRMQYAVNQTAKEISQYFYVAYKFGLNYEGMNDNKSVNEVFSAVNGLGGEAVKAYNGTSGNIDDMKNTISGINTDDPASIQNAVNTIKETFTGEDNPISMIKSLVAAFDNMKEAIKNCSGGEVLKTAGNSAGALAMTAIASPISKLVIKKYISSDKNVDNRLKAWGIQDGWKGLNFDASSFLFDGQTIKVAVTYTVKIFGFGFFDREKKLSQVAITRAWIGNDEKLHISKYS